MQAPICPYIYTRNIRARFARASFRACMLDLNSYRLQQRRRDSAAAAVVGTVMVIVMVVMRVMVMMVLGVVKMRMGSQDL